MLCLQMSFAKGLPIPAAVLLFDQVLVPAHPPESCAIMGRKIGVPGKRGLPVPQQVILLTHDILWAMTCAWFGSPSPQQGTFDKLRSVCEDWMPDRSYERKRARYARARYFDEEEYTSDSSYSDDE